MTEIEDRIQGWNDGFEELLSYIPAKLYYREQTTNQWKQKKSSSEEKKERRKMKFSLDGLNDEEESQKEGKRPPNWSAEKDNGEENEDSDRRAESMSQIRGKLASKIQDMREKRKASNLDQKKQNKKVSTEEKKTASKKKSPKNQASSRAGF
ncbi:ribosome biogenesis protein Rrp14-N [Schizosaccharomyces cryophilus OY26]|uniref:Ribosome biogenesis protein Rrp14-N n=1 Tax=Schizosaccharomyces cryophilus (strain OY26 / ATCC MYA-4695 / CBS 11777 / NBRC 106824 / NRRL Y48691) TaxID=653667 RepID=S9W351_SCHCR|nr:ribosome biogenesis protein Rrp14-N [Schizosaccharomyces cryophilus OY26]EPY52989.1 ribosome biogenesis protein Rrp14-N [Schizosaccharomyces cryophilus OY26]